MFYAVAVWYGAVRWRRRWQGFAWVASGVLGVLAMIRFHFLLEAWTPYTIYLPVLQTLLWSYALLVGAIGLFVVCIPHRHGPWCCQACGYDLSGVPGFTHVCPECGRGFSAATARAAEARLAPLVPNPTLAQGRTSGPRDMAHLLHHTSLHRPRSASHDAPHAAEKQDEQGQAQHEPPSQR